MSLKALWGHGSSLISANAYKNAVNSSILVGESSYDRDQVGHWALCKMTQPWDILTFRMSLADRDAVSF